MQMPEGHQAQVHFLAEKTMETHMGSSHDRAELGADSDDAPPCNLLNFDA